ncbi:glycosyltransferase family A protein [Azospirillum rugosum]|uniref:Glycosyltransferase 2-like domain-containing protein n=1 Tax=Azospirillum rugosum TaxID=416170 RepID=A0ABS4SFY2_9PROT|nr:glycosyltransferase family A protein [Azospirillum rugosum]MBP2291350.1 hypothetical protein [Azospirillum rugosum]MDQ0525138.1 hypothetical protein [Azospirillum rugosum]
MPLLRPVMSIVSTQIAPPPDDADHIRAAIIVPTYKHSGLLAEALDTALAQDTDFAFAVVVVNDGCPFPETDRVCREFAASYPGRVFYLNKRNSGLSAARNSGIAFALDAFPALEAVYFLDSDNRIRPHLLQRMLDALRASGPEVGWAYPDVDKFGFFEFCDMSGPYSPLEHLFRNVSEAGSMASRRLLDSGARFDETMRQGSEDWEFWLQGLERGFHGVHVPGTGFGYRRRGESMLTESERDYRPILTHIQGRHPALFSVKAIARAEAAVGRRYAVFLPDRAVVRCTTDPALGVEDLPLADFVRRALRAPERPDYAACPGQLVVMDSALYALLERHKLLQGVLWTLERTSLQASLVYGRVTVEASEEGGVSTQWAGVPVGLEDTVPAPLPSGGAEIVALQTRTLLDLVRRQPTGAPLLEREYDKPCAEAHLHLRLAVPDPIVPSWTVDAALVSLYDTLARQWSIKAVGGWAAAPIDRYRAGVATPRDVYWTVHQLPTALPLLRDGRQAALVVEPGCPRKHAIALRMAQWLRERGYRPHLVAMGSGKAAWTPGDADTLDTVIPFPMPLVLPERPLTRREAYLGTPVRDWDNDEEDLAVGTLAAFDLVVTVQHGPAHGLMGRLRKLGVTTWALLGLPEAGRTAADVVNACAAFEHAYQTIVPLDARSFRLCQALALPLDKLRRWGSETGEGNDPDWDACPALVDPFTPSTPPPSA